jgi:hypothetical protein
MTARVRMLRDDILPVEVSDDDPDGSYPDLLRRAADVLDALNRPPPLAIRVTEDECHIELTVIVSRHDVPGRDLGDIEGELLNGLGCDVEGAP